MFAFLRTTLITIPISSLRHPPPPRPKMLWKKIEAEVERQEFFLVIPCTHRWQLRLLPRTSEINYYKLVNLKQHILSSGSQKSEIRVSPGPHPILGL